MPPDTVAKLLGEAQQRLKEAGIESAALDARLLLQAAANLRHDEIIAGPTLIVPQDACLRFAAMVERRRVHEPVSRILGEREFYGRMFRVTPATLDPRPDTETLVDEGLDHLPPDRPARIIDLGTGTGAIIVSIMAERPLVSGVAVDVSAEALDVARNNAERHGVSDRLELHLGNWFEGVADGFDLIVSNPPYIAAGDIAGLAPEVRLHDPGLAFDGGADGLEAYRRIAADASPLLMKSGRISVEIGAGQVGEVTTIFAEKGFALVNIRKDLAGSIRVLTFQPG